MAWKPNKNIEYKIGTIRINYEEGRPNGKYYATVRVEQTDRSLGNRFYNLVINGLNGPGVSKARQKVRRFLYSQGFINNHLPLNNLTVEGYEPKKYNPLKPAITRLETEVDKIQPGILPQAPIKRKRGRPRKNSSL